MGGFSLFFSFFFFGRGGRDPSGGRVLNPASLRCFLGSGGSDFSHPAGA